jgi:hypothetical protein
LINKENKIIVSLASFPQLMPNKVMSTLTIYLIIVGLSFRNLKCGWRVSPKEILGSWRENLLGSVGPVFLKGS